VRTDLERDFDMHYRDTMRRAYAAHEQTAAKRKKKKAMGKETSEQFLERVRKLATQCDDGTAVGADIADSLCEICREAGGGGAALEALRSTVREALVARVQAAQQGLQLLGLEDERRRASRREIAGMTIFVRARPSSGARAPARTSTSTEPGAE
jgi:hypothetical protein